MDVTQDESATTWSEIPQARLPELVTQRLSRTGARVEQYPFFNERFRSALVTPRYLCAGSLDAPAAYACVLTVGAWPVRVGLVAHGPVSLDGAARPPLNVVRGLARWARAQSYAFLRITHEDADFLSSLDALGGVEVHDPFRRFLAPESELVVRLRDSDEALLASFDESARRYTRRAAARGYDIVKEDSPEALAALWPFFQAHAQRKGLHYRPLERYSTLMALARSSGRASLYVASLEGVTINAILVLRDRDMAHYQLGALDVKALGKNPTPAFLLHHRAMGDARALGATSYNLGIRAGPVYEFKRKFRPEEIFPPPARTLVLRPALYRAWTRVVGRYAPSLMALLRGRRR